MGIERRQSARYAVSWRGRIALPGKGLYQVSIIDISQGGIGIIFNHALALNSSLSVEFFVKFRGDRKCIRAKAKVVFVTVLSDNRGAKMGLQFSAISQENINVLSGVIEIMEESNF